MYLLARDDDDAPPEDGGHPRPVQGGIVAQLRTMPDTCTCMRHASLELNWLLGMADRVYKYARPIILPAKPPAMPAMTPSIILFRPAVPHDTSGCVAETSSC